MTQSDLIDPESMFEGLNMTLHESSLQLLLDTP